MVFDVVKLSAPILREVAPELEDITDKDVRLVDRMRFFLSKVDGYGLAANQIGYNKRIFVYNIGDGFKTIINPRIGELDNEMWLYEEGCLSIPGFAFPIWGPRKTYLFGVDINGNDIRVEADHILSRLFQHEIDHLSGKLVIDLLTNEEKEEFYKQWRIQREKGRKKR